VLLSEKDEFSLGSANRKGSLWPNGPMPGQKSIRFAKKGGEPSFPKAGFRRFSPGIPLPPHLFAETKRGELGGFLPALFVFAPVFLPGQQGNGSERPTKLETIQFFLPYSEFFSQDRQEARKNHQSDAYPQGIEKNITPGTLPGRNKGLIKLIQGAHTCGDECSRNQPWVNISPPPRAKRQEEQQG